MVLLSIWKEGAPKKNYIQKPNVTLPQPTTEILFHDGFESGQIDTGWTEIIKSRNAAPNAYQFVTNPVREGSWALKMMVESDDYVTPGDRTLKKERLELKRSVPTEGIEGSELWYSWSVYIPEGYNYVTNPEKRHNLHIIAQWHDQPPAGGAPLLNTPPISLNYIADDKGNTGIRIVYGPEGVKKQKLETPIKLGEWVDWTFHIKWSLGNAGFAEVWKNGEKLVWEEGKDKVVGRNMFNSEPHFLKIGIYRGHGLQGTTTVYYDDVTISAIPPTGINR